MKKMRLFKRITAVVLSAAMITALAACGSSGGSSSTEQAETAAAAQAQTEGQGYHLAFNTFGDGNATFDFMIDVIAQAMDAAGATYEHVSDDRLADKELNNIQNFINSGVDGLIMQTAAPSIFSTAAQQCEEAQLPWANSTFTGSVEDRAEINGKNPYYCGSVVSDTYEEGYLLGKLAAKDGYTKAIMVGGNVGDALFDNRSAGFRKAFVDEEGMEVLDEARAASPAECQEKANASFNAYPEADVVYAMNGDYAPGVVSAMEIVGIKLPIYCCNCNSDNIEDIKSGTFAAATAGNDLVGTLAVCLLINYLDGHQILDENGLAPELVNVGFIVDSSNVDGFEFIFGETHEPYPQEVIQQLLWRYNPDVTYQDYVDFIENKMNIEYMMEAWGK